MIQKWIASYTVEIITFCVDASGGWSDDNVVSYIAGYAMKKMNEQLACNNCRNAYVTSSARSQGELYISGGSHLTFIGIKTYDWAKHGLLAPSVELHSLCTSIEKAVEMNLETLSIGRNVMRNLKDCMVATVDLNSYHIDCAEHHQQQFEYMYNL